MGALPVLLGHREGTRAMKKMNGIGHEDSVTCDDARAGLPAHRDSLRDVRDAFDDWKVRQGLERKRIKAKKKFSKRKRK